MIVQLAESNSKGGRLPAPVSRDVQLIAGGLLMVLATLVVYGPALPGDVLWDDDQYVSENRLLFVEDGLWRIWTCPSESPQYYPLVFTSFWLEARLWGLSTFGLHLVNVLLHALNALLLWSVLRRLQVPGAWLAGALFALHPVHVESVAWITERKNVLSGLFFLLSVAAYVEHTRRRRGTLYGLALVAFAAALLSKTATCFLPVVLLLVCWWRQPGIGRRDTLELAPFFGLALTFGVLTIIQEKHDVGAQGAEWALSVPQRALLAARALWFYAGKLVWPARLTFNYPRWTVDPADLRAYVFPVLTVAAGVGWWPFRRRLGRAPLVALGCYVAGLAPVLGFFNVYYFRYSYVADHFQYHASMGFIALMAAALTLVLRWLEGRHGTLSGLSRVVFLLPLVCGVLTFRQAGLYTDVKTLWQRTIERNPASWLARYNLALLLVRDNERNDEAAREAKEHLQAVLEINPQCGDAHVALGNIAGRRGEHDEAMAHYHAALVIDPNDTQALYNMARELSRVGDVEGAIVGYQACLEKEPECAPAHNGLGRILLERGERRGAAEHFRRALEADPRNVWALHNLGMVCEGDGHYAEAVRYYRSALIINPGMADSWFRIGVCRRTTGDLPGAEVAYRHALDLRPDYAEALVDLAGIDYDAERFEQAAEAYRRAVGLNPNNVGWRVNLADAYRQLGEDANAVGVLEAGLQVQPDDLTLTHELAKVLATASDANVRDGGRALELATKVVERLDPPRPEAFRTLSAAYAELGQYAQAAESARRGVEAARTLGLPDLEEQLAEQLRGYEERMRDPLE